MTGDELEQHNTVTPYLSVRRQQVTYQKVLSISDIKITCKRPNKSIFY